MADSTRISLLDRIRETTTGESWQEFVGVYEAVIAGWLGRQDVQLADAEDICQEVMATVHREIANFEHSGRTGAFRTWLRRITSNRLHQHWQRHQRNPGAYAGPDLSELAELLADDSSRLTLIWEKQHDQFVLDHLLLKLHGRFGENSLAAFQRVALEQEPAAEVAASLGMTLGAVRVAQHRVSRALQEMGRGLIE